MALADQPDGKIGLFCCGPCWPARWRLVDGVCSLLPWASGVYLNGGFELWIVSWLTVPACPSPFLIFFLTRAALKGLALQGLMFVSLYLWRDWLCGFDWRKDSYIWLYESNETCICIYEFDHPEVTMCGWLDIKILMTPWWPFHLDLIVKHLGFRVSWAE